MASVSAERVACALISARSSAASSPRVRSSVSAASESRRRRAHVGSAAVSVALVVHRVGVPVR